MPPSPTVHSFDVFETVLVRAVGEPGSVFLLLGRRLGSAGLIRCSAEVFARARASAETTVRRRVAMSREEIELGEIYAELAWSGIVAPEQAVAAAAAEAGLEQSLTRPVPRARELVEAARHSGREIIFISDMYLPHATLAQALRRHGLLTERDRLYVSSTHGALKRTGSLYRTVLKLEGRSPREFLHHGNDAVTDVAMAAEAGLSARHLPEGNLTSGERLLESRAWETGGLSSLFAGASRLARLRMPAALEDGGLRRSAYLFGATTVGPVLVAYTLWVLRRAADLGITRLYFLSRDGYVLYRLAQHLAPALQLGLQLEYLYGSRRAWGRAGIASGEAGCLDWLLRDPGENFGHVFRRLSIPDDGAAALLARFGRGPGSLARGYAPEDRDLLNRQDFREALIAAARPAAQDAHERTVGYLRQAGLLDGQRYAIVDIGWHGTLHTCLRRVLAPHQADFGHAFYFGAYALPDAACRARSLVYYGDGEAGRGAALRKPDHFCLLEIMTTGLEGTLLDYAPAPTGGWTPVLSSATNGPALASGAAELLDGTLAFAESLQLDPDLVDLNADCRPVVHDVLTQLWNHPTREQAEVVGWFPFEGGMGDLPDRTCPARPYSLRESLRLAANRPVTRIWHPGSVALSPRWIRRVLRVGTAVRRRIGADRIATAPSRREAQATAVI